MKASKHIPERKCIGCQERFPKPELMRVVRQPDGTVISDKTGKASGRGAYLCKKESCLTVAYRKGRLQTALECKIPEELYATLKESLGDE